MSGPPFHVPQAAPCGVCSHAPPLPEPRTTTNLLSISVDLPLLDSSVHRITWYVSFDACLRSLSVMSPRLVSVGANIGGTSFLFVAD